MGCHPGRYLWPPQALTIASTSTHLHRESWSGPPASTYSQLTSLFSGGHCLQSISCGVSWALERFEWDVKKEEENEEPAVHLGTSAFSPKRGSRASGTWVNLEEAYWGEWGKASTWKHTVPFVMWAKWIPTWEDFVSQPRGKNLQYSLYRLLLWQLGNRFTSQSLWFYLLISLVLVFDKMSPS